MAEDDDKKKNMVVLGICSVLLLAMVVALTIGTGRYDTTVHNKEVNVSKKAIQSICQPTTYQEACIKSLESSLAKNETDPKELIQASIDITITRLHEAMKKSTLFKEVEKDPRSKEAMKNCHVLADWAVDDLNRTFNKFSEFDLNNLHNWLSDLKTWLSGSLTYQETCLDGFHEIPGDYQEKMKKLLTTSMQLTSNALAMVTEISTVLSGIGVEGVSSANKRRLLEVNTPDWVELGRRKLLTAKKSKIRPDLVVAKDGSGKYKTINDALKDIPRNKNRTFILYIKEGVYDEQVTFFRNMTHLMIIGDGPTKTKITGNKNFVDGISTFHTATVAALGDFFMARDIGFENSAGAEKHQAVALRIGADKSIFYNCQMDGYQDTLYAHTYNQFYRNCVISGTIDFIFGNSAAVLQNCTLVVRKPMDNQQCIVTAQGRIDPRQPTGLVLQNCSFVAGSEYKPVRFTLKSYLGRPWKEYSRTIIMESYIDDFIQEDGWLPWAGNFALKTLFYTEYNNRGPASSKKHRVQWEGVKELPLNRIERFTAARFIEGDLWIKSTGLPYNPGFIFPPPKPEPEVKYSPVGQDETKDLGATEKAAYDPPKTKSPPPPPPPVPSNNKAASAPKRSTASAPQTSTDSVLPLVETYAPTVQPEDASVEIVFTPYSAPAPAPGPDQSLLSPNSDLVPVSSPFQAESAVQDSTLTFSPTASVSSPAPTQLSTPVSSPDKAEAPTQASSSPASESPNAAAPMENSPAQAPLTVTSKISTSSKNMATQVLGSAISQNTVVTLPPPDNSTPAQADAHAPSTGKHKDSKISGWSFRIF